MIQHLLFGNQNYKKNYLLFGSQFQKNKNKIYLKILEICIIKDYIQKNVILLK